MRDSLWIAQVAQGTQVARGTQVAGGDSLAAPGVTAFGRPSDGSRCAGWETGSRAVSEHQGPLLSYLSSAPNLGLLASNLPQRPGGSMEDSGQQLEDLYVTW